MGYSEFMQKTANEKKLDVRKLPPKDRHPVVTKTWERLDCGSSLLLVNDHDPLPLYHQFACQYEGQFQWTYLEQGPEVWQVRLAKGNFPDPGYAPPRKTSRTTGAPKGPMEPKVVDTRPIFAQGLTPCGAIDEAVAELMTGQILILLVPFEPVPLYAKLAKNGYSHQSKVLEDGTWRIEFRPNR